MKREKQIHNVKTGVCISTGLVVSLILMGAAAAQAAVITSEAELQSMSTTVDNELGNDITLSGSWTPHASLGASATFDGKGFTIDGLNAGVSGSNRGGLFHDVHGKILNLTLEGSVSGQWNVGGLAGYLRSGAVISNCTIDVTVSGHEQVGGVISDMIGGTMYGVTVSGSVTATSQKETGGLVAWMRNGTITECRFSGLVINTANGMSEVGGLVGNMDNGTIQRSYSSGAVSAQGEFLGGLVGHMNAGTIRDSYASGGVTNARSSADQTGGLVGETGVSVTISDCYFSGDIHCVGTATAGGLVGDNYGDMDDCFTVSEITYQWIQYLGGCLAIERDGTEANVWWYSAIANASGYGSSAGMTKATAKSDFHDDANAPLSSWDFATVWVEEPGDYPQLQAFVDAPAGAVGTVVTIR